MGFACDDPDDLLRVVAGIPEFSGGHIDGMLRSVEFSGECDRAEESSRCVELSQVAMREKCDCEDLGWGRANLRLLTELWSWCTHFSNDWYRPSLLP